MLTLSIDRFFVRNLFPVDKQPVFKFQHISSPTSSLPGLKKAQAQRGISSTPKVSSVNLQEKKILQRFHAIILAEIQFTTTAPQQFLAGRCLLLRGHPSSCRDRCCFLGMGLHRGLFLLLP